MKNLIIAFLFALSFMACSEEEVKPVNDQLMEYELDFHSLDHSDFKMQFQFGVNQLGDQIIAKNDTVFNVYIKKGDAIHVRITEAKSAIRVQIAPDNMTFVNYDLTLNETLIVKP